MCPFALCEKLDMFLKLCKYLKSLAQASKQVVNRQEPHKWRGPQNPQSTGNSSIRQRTNKVGSLFLASSDAFIATHYPPKLFEFSLSPCLDSCSWLLLQYQCNWKLLSQVTEQTHKCNNNQWQSKPTSPDILVYSKQANIHSLQSICVLWREMPRKSRHNDWRNLLMDRPT